MAFLPDHILDHLRGVAEIPDLSGTRYSLEGELGRGGMAVVYRARDTQLGREVAFKVMDDDVEMASQEAALIAQLEHPGIVPLYEAGRLPDGRFYYVMKLVRGMRMDQFLERESALPERLRMFQKVCEAVAFAHSRHVIHCDLKPQNVMVGTFGEVLVMDWGIARRSGGGEQPAMVAGTPRYMAPEQAAGDSAMDQRVDIFSLGALLRNFLKGARVRPVCAIAEKATSAQPAERYSSVAEMSADLARFMDELPVLAYRENVVEHAVRFARRNATLLLLLGVFLAVKVIFYLLR